LEIFEDIVKKVESSGAKLIPGSEVFRLYDTYGFPVDLTEIMAKERGLHVDMVTFEEELGKQKERSKQSSTFADKGIIFDAELPQTVFHYDAETIKSHIIHVGRNDDKAYLVLRDTPFYAESGGQVGDTGKIYSHGFEFRVDDTQKVGSTTIHLGQLLREFKSIEPLFQVKAEIDHSRRAEIKKNHTATHLLHKALRMVLGEHVHQAGSLVAPDRLRFDFTHFKAMTPQEIEQVEQIVQQKISENLRVEAKKDVPLSEAKQMGAMALFGEKYGDTVRVVTTGDPPFSMELCGGTHVNHTSEIGNFIITQETAIAAGMRRIEALTGNGARKFLDEQENIVSQIKEYIEKDVDKLTEDDISRFNTMVGNAHRRVLQLEGLIEQIDEFQARFGQKLKLMQKEAHGKLAEWAAELMPRASIGDGKILVFEVPAGDAKNLMVFSDTLKNNHPNSTILTISDKSGAFALTSNNGGRNQEVFKAIMSISGARGGGQQTIRGNMPVGKIDAVIDGLKQKYG
jgi:alanyl-tRNA synthetase